MGDGLIAKWEKVTKGWGEEMTDLDADRQLVKKRKSKSVSYDIEGLNGEKIRFTRNADELSVTVQIGKESMDLDYWAWEALHELNWELEPKKPEEKLLDIMGQRTVPEVGNDAE